MVFNILNFNTLFNFKTFDVVSVGSVTLDIFIPFDKTLSFNHHDFFSLEVGDKILVEDYFVDLGGGSANVNLSFKKLGLYSSFVSKIGNDFFGEKIFSLIKEYSLNFSGSKVNGNSAFSIILNNDSDRTIVAFKGVVEDPLNNIVLPKSKFYYFTSPSKKGLKSYLNTFKLLKNSKNSNKSLNHNLKYDFKVVFNPSSYITNLGLNNSILKQLLFFSDVVILNKDELFSLFNIKDDKKDDKLDMNVKVKSKKFNFNNRKDLEKKFVDIIHSLNTDIVVVTDGSNDIFVSCKSTGEKYFVSPWKIKVKDTTGAGDAFGSTFVAVLYKTQDLLKAVKFALINSESVVKHLGAKKGLLSFEELEFKSKRLKLNYRKV